VQDTDRTRENGKEPEDSWNRLRGILKDVFAELGGGEAYLRTERSNFQSMKAEETDVASRVDVVTSIRRGLEGSQEGHGTANQRCS
jgi:hypothetical protein